MKLSQETIAILKNFSMIQPNLVVEPGSVISTLAEAKHIMAEADINETFDQGFGIYDLHEFLSALTLLNDPDLSISESSMTIEDENARVKFHFADTDILTKKTSSIQMPPADISFTFTEQAINAIRRAAAALKLETPVLSITVEEDDIIAKVMCLQNPTSNSYSMVIGKHEGDPIDSDFRFDINNLKLIAGDYTVDITKKLISNWKHQSNPIQYWIALDKTSNV